MTGIKNRLVHAFLYRVRLLAEFEPNDTFRDAYIAFLRNSKDN